MWTENKWRMLLEDICTGRGKYFNEITPHTTHCCVCVPCAHVLFLLCRSWKLRSERKVDRAAGHVPYLHRFCLHGRWIVSSLTGCDGRAHSGRPLLIEILFSDDKRNRNVGDVLRVVRLWTDAQKRRMIVVWTKTALCKRKIENTSRYVMIQYSSHPRFHFFSLAISLVLFPAYYHHVLHWALRSVGLLLYFSISLPFSAISRFQSSFLNDNAWCLFSPSFYSLEQQKKPSCFDTSTSFVCSIGYASLMADVRTMSMTYRYINGPLYMVPRRKRIDM